MKIHRPHIENHKNTEAGATRKLKDDFRYVPKEYLKVAQGLEQQFAEYMLKQMKNTIGGSGEDDTAMDYYKDLNQTEQAKVLSEVKTGLGIQKLILDEIYPEKFRNPQALAAFSAHQNQGLIKKKKIEMVGPPTADKIEKHESVSIGREANHE